MEFLPMRDWKLREGMVIRSAKMLPRRNGYGCTTGAASGSDENEVTLLGRWRLGFGGSFGERTLPVFAIPIALWQNSFRQDPEPRGVQRLSG